MSNKRDNKSDNKQDATKGGFLDGITGLTNAAQDAVKQAEEASQSPMDRINEMATAARETAEAAKKQRDAAAIIAQAQAADAQQATQQHQTPADQIRQVAESARKAAEAAQKQKAIADAQHAAKWARIEAESAKRAEEARQAEQQEQFQGSGGVGSQEQLDSIRQGYADSSTADPSGLNLDADHSASTQDNTSKASGLTDEDRARD